MKNGYLLDCTPGMVVSESTAFQGSSPGVFFFTFFSGRVSSEHRTQPTPMIERDLRMKKDDRRFRMRERE